MKSARLAGVAVAVAVLGVGGCGALEDGGASGGAAASCAAVVDFDGRRYSGSGTYEYERGEKVGTATEPPCDDTPNDGDEGTSARRVTAYAIKGVDPDVAVAVSDAPEDVVYIADPGDEVPPELAKLRRAPTEECVGTHPAPTASDTGEGRGDDPDDTPLYRTVDLIDRLAAKRYAHSFTGLSVDQDDNAADLYRVPSAAFDEAVCDGAEKGVTVRIHDTDANRKDLDALAERITDDMKRWDGTFQLREVGVDERGWVHVGVDDPGTAEPLVHDAFGTEHIKVVHVEQAHLD